MDAAISINSRQREGSIDPNIYGHFWEHFADIIYGGVYDPASPKADEDGFRADLIEALREMRAPLIRWPGGNFASSYCWKDGVGPREARPVRFDPKWRVDESNQFGTDEFLGLCEKIIAEPCLVVNMGDGTLKDAADWVEYCNGSGESSCAALRRKHGHREPYGVTFWGLGNEVGYAHQVGAYSDVGDYIKDVVSYARSMKFVDPEIRLIASGLDVYNGEHGQRGMDWNYRLLTEAGGWLDYISVHNYLHGGFAGPRRSYEEVAAHLNTIESELKITSGLVEAVRQYRPKERPLSIAFDEWNQLGWCIGAIDLGLQEQHADSNDDNSAYDIVDALYSASMLNLFIRMSEYVTMANFSPTVNARGFLRVESRGVLKRPSWHVFKLFRLNHGNRTVNSYVECDSFAGRPVLDVAASLDERDGGLTVSVVNWSRDREIAARLQIRSGAGSYSEAGEHVIRVKDGLRSYNDWDHPDDVSPEYRKGKGKPEGRVYRHPPQSVTILQFRRQVFADAALEKHRKTH